MATLNEVKEQVAVVKSVGDFTNALQQIATMRMMKLRSKVMDSRPFIDAATTMLRELLAVRAQLDAAGIRDAEKKRKNKGDARPVQKEHAVIVITSNQGLAGRYNPEIYSRVEKVIRQLPEADYYVIGKKGQEYFGGGKFKVVSYPYAVADNFTVDDLRRLTNLFDYYRNVTLVYSRFINTATREVVATAVLTPELPPSEDHQIQPGTYIFEPQLTDLIESTGKRLRAALFQQQIFDARLAQYAAQMIGMKTASDNAVGLLADLRLEYNKQRRKMIDKKIGEVFAGSALW
jgi:F-type H+-transporting ATPase subunit gamma